MSERPGQDLAAALEAPGFYAGDPFPHYARMRREAPLAWNADLGYWAVTKHADVVAISRDPEAFCSGKGHPHVRDRRRVPEPAHDDAHRSARAHALPQARAAGLRAFAHPRLSRVRVRARADELVARDRAPAHRSTRWRRSRSPSRSGSSPSCSASPSPTGRASTNGRRPRSRARPTGRPRSARGSRPRCTSTCSR